MAFRFPDRDQFSVLTEDKTVQDKFCCNRAVGEKKNKLEKNEIKVKEHC